MQGIKKRLAIAILLIGVQSKTKTITPEQDCFNRVAPITEGFGKGQKSRLDIADCRLYLLEGRVSKLEKQLRELKEK